MNENNKDMKKTRYKVVYQLRATSTILDKDHIMFCKGENTNMIGITIEVMCTEREELIRENTKLEGCSHIC